VSDIGLDALNATGIVNKDGALKTTREVWCQDTIQRARWVFDPGKDELSSRGNYSTGTVHLADMSIGETQLAFPLS